MIMVPEPIFWFVVFIFIVAVLVGFFAWLLHTGFIGR